MEGAWAVTLARLLYRLRGLIPGGGRRRTWPPFPGNYRLGSPQGPVAICTLTDADSIPEAAAIPGVALAGSLATANLGIERIVRNVIANPSIRYLVLWGRDSPLFRQGQTLRALCASGVDGDRRVIGASGYLPRLSGLAPEVIDRFRAQVELVDRTGADAAALAATVRDLTARTPAPLLPAGAVLTGPEPIPRIRPGGLTEPVAYDLKGNFVVSLDRGSQEIVVIHHLPNATPAHEIRGRHGGGILLGLLRENLVSQLSHAGYLGAELAKAETALRLDLDYRQDRPLRKPRERPHSP